MTRQNDPSSPATSEEPQPDAAVTTAVRPFGPRDWLFAVALVAAVFLVYQPAWHGERLWDDDAHITHPELRSWHGLYRIWFDVGATQQYYPLSESAFWVQYKLWGDGMTGYHLVNIALHALTALMVALALRQLAIPGAFLAAAIFALHPVHVESVAWITEQKNTLSAVFYLGAAMAYLRFDRNRGTAWYWGALGLFVLALSGKIVTVTLPAALLVIFWWQRGKLSWRRDVVPLVPFFAIGMVAGVFITWVERKLVGAEGPDFTLTVVQRCLLPGRAIWFYLGKLLWPADLHFMYPRWEISPAVCWQYLFPLALLILLGVLWRLSWRWRGPLAGLLFFAGTLFPVWGFLNVYWFKFSYVADHFQYLASLGIIALATAGAASTLTRWGVWDRPGGYVLCLALLAGLAGLTWRQSREYVDVETLYRTVIAEKPDCWLAYNNLGNVLRERGQRQEAIDLFHRAMEIKPDYAEIHNNLGVALAGQKRGVEAIAEYGKALELQPDYADAHNNLGNALVDAGRFDEAVAHFNQALEIKPDYAKAHNNFGVALAQKGRFDEAIDHYRKALEIDADNAEVHNNLGSALIACGQVDDAIAHYQKALRIKPDYADVHNNLGVALGTCGRLDEAAAHFDQALEIKPDYADARNNLGMARSQHEKILQALARQRELLRSRPDDPALVSDIAWTLATNPNASIRNGTEAIGLAQRAVQLSDGQQPAVLDVLAAAQAEAGRFAEAVATAERALAICTNDTALAEALHARIKLYQNNSPCRETRQFSSSRSNRP